MTITVEMAKMITANFLTTAVESWKSVALGATEIARPENMCVRCRQSLLQYRQCMAEFHDTMVNLSIFTVIVNVRYLQPYSHQLYRTSKLAEDNLSGIKFCWTFC